MIGATLYLCGMDAKTGEFVENSSCCQMCKRMVINAGIERVIIRDSAEKFRVISVSDWVENDDSLGQTGY